MKYIYIFDYTFGRIYEAKVPENELFDYRFNIEAYLVKNYNINPNQTHYMISDEKLEIETIDKIN